MNELINLHSDITRKVIGCAMKVHSTLGNGFSEIIYQKALAIEMGYEKIPFVREFEMPIFYRGELIGRRRVDFLVEECVSIEIKALKELDNSNLAQGKNYLEAYNLEIGLLLNFGSTSLQYKRLFNDKTKRKILRTIFKILNPVNPLILKILVQILLPIFFLLAVQSCTELPTSVVQNQPPNTFLSLFPDSTISPQRTRIRITWWGDDPDGLVTGFRFSFDSTNWTYTTKNDSTFQLAISGNDSTFHFWVAAVDDKGMIDPTPASNRYPVFNSPPSVIFNAGAKIPDTTFTIASFSWTGTDPDGDNTIKYYYWALNDTLTWHRIPASVNLLTLRQDSGLAVNSDNILFLKAQDIAGAFSNISRMPDTGSTWYVRRPVGRILIIDDYSFTLTDKTQAFQFYENALDTISHSRLDIKVSNGANIPPIRNPMFIETLKLFQCVIWYSDRTIAVSQNANFDLAQETLPFYLAAGGKVFFTSGFPDNIPQGINYVDFAPVDSVSVFQQGSIPEETPVIVVDNNYPLLQASSPTPNFVRGLYPRPGTHIIYKMPYNPPYDTNKINVCIKDVTGNPKIVLMSVALHKMNFANNAADFLRRVIYTDFGIR